MATVIRALRENEAGVYIPVREVLEPEATEVVRAVAHFVATLMDRGVRDERGDALVAVDESLRVACPYEICAD